MAHDRSDLERHNGVASDRSASSCQAARGTSRTGGDSRCEWNASQCDVFLSVAAPANGTATEA
jgi:hypothetical protein